MSKNCKTLSGYGKKSTPNRRQILTAAAASPLLSQISIAGSAGRSIRIVTDRAGIDRKAIKTRKVPNDWYRHEVAMRSANRRIADQYLAHDFVESVYVGAASKSADGLAYAQQVIEVNESANQPQVNTLPESLADAGVPVPQDVVIDDILIKEVPGNSELMVCYGQESPDPFPGGVWINDTDGNGGAGTSGYHIYDSNGNDYILSANHVFATDGCDNCDLATYTSMKAVNGDVIGQVVDGHKNHDWAVAEPTEDISSIDTDIWYDEGLKRTIGGYKTENGVSTLKGQTGEAKKQGRATSYNSGTVSGYNESKQVGCGIFTPCIRMDRNGVKVDVDVAPGDSGGPIWSNEFYPEFGGTYASIITHTCIGSGDVIGTACNTEDITNEVHGWPAYAIVNNNDYGIGNI